MSHTSSPAAEPDSDRERSRGKSWYVATIALVIILPLLHLLSVPAVTLYNARGGPEMFFVGFRHGWPDWVSTYRLPYDWLMKNTSLRMPMAQYEVWCWDTITARRLRHQSIRKHPAP